MFARYRQQKREKLIEERFTEMVWQTQNNCGNVFMPKDQVEQALFEEMVLKGKLVRVMGTGRSRAAYRISFGK